MVDEVRVRARRELEEVTSMGTASYLVDDRPPGGWSELVTREALHLELEAVEHRVRAEIAGLAAELRSEMRDQTWRLMGTLLVAMGLVAAILRVG
jgi:hypothetical protein